MASASEKAAPLGAKSGHDEQRCAASGAPSLHQDEPENAAPPSTLMRLAFLPCLELVEEPVFLLLAQRRAAGCLLALVEKAGKDRL